MAANRPVFIIDASVVLKWFLEDEDDLQNALELKKDHAAKRIELAIPSHAYAEILNLFGRKFSQKQALSFFSLLLALELEERSITLEIASFALEIMEKFKNVSFYDACYHAFALEQNTIFITADQKYFSKTKKQGNIMLLKDYGKKR